MSKGGLSEGGCGVMWYFANLGFSSALPVILLLSRGGLSLGPPATKSTAHLFNNAENRYICGRVAGLHKPKFLNLLSVNHEKLR